MSTSAPVSRVEKDDYDIEPNRRAIMLSTMRFGKTLAITADFDREAGGPSIPNTRSPAAAPLSRRSIPGRSERARSPPHEFSREARVVPVCMNQADRAKTPQVQG